MVLSTDKTVREAKTFEKAQAIAAELRKGGEYVAYGQDAGVFGLYKKSYSNAPDTSYLVNLNSVPVPTCSCPDFESHKDYCKHIWGLKLALDEDAQEDAQCKEYDELQAVLEPFGYFAY